MVKNSLGLTKEDMDREYPNTESFPLSKIARTHVCWPNSKYRCFICHKQVPRDYYYVLESYGCYNYMEKL